MISNSSKYKLIVSHVTSGILNGIYKRGSWIPSINEFMKKYKLSRDTVFTGLSELKSKGIIDSRPGLGYYITSTRISHHQKIFLLFNEFNAFKEELLVHSCTILAVRSLSTCFFIIITGKFLIRWLTKQMENIRPIL